MRVAGPWIAGAYLDQGMPREGGKRDNCQHNILGIGSRGRVG